MKEIRTEDAVGHILCHDITQIIKDVKKGVLFKKGHIIREEDIPLLLSVGKEHLYVWEKKEGILHENEGAQILYEICAGDSEIIHGSDIKEGKIELIADIDGVSSHSVGVEPYRKVVITSDNPRKNYNRKGKGNGKYNNRNRKGGKYRRDDNYVPKPKSMDSMKTSFEKEYSKPKPEDNIEGGLYGKIEL